MIYLLIDYKNVFPWSYKELKGISRETCVHRIEFMAYDQFIIQRQYRMNPNYALNYFKNLDKLLDASFIYLIETT
jgi:hypothetical protein